ncbi:MAG: DUF3108 domain-containing protein [Cardiobacteriaceae bacterium]|nr:DUF3108 domain-containing protein [Cardiobacteriaceae bacterium]
MALCKLRRLLLPLFALGLGNAFALDNYHATYDLQIRGVNAGKVRHEAIFTGNTYRIDTFAKPAPAAKLLGYGDIRETVTGFIRKGDVQPERYRRTMESDASFQLEYIFVPAERRVDVNIAGKAQALVYEGDVPLDTLSMVVQTLLDVEQGKIRTHYSLLNDEQVRRYQVEAQADELWEGKIPARVFRQVHGNRETRIYLGENPLRLLALTQSKDGKIRFSLKLADYRKS